MSGEQVPLLVVGDAAYPMRSWLIKDYRGQLTAQQRVFNQKLNSAQVVVEQSFGRLKCRWRRILKRSEHRWQLVPRMLLAAATLHNFTESAGDCFHPAWAAAAQAADAANPQPEARIPDPRMDNADGRRYRELLLEHVAARLPPQLARQ